MNTEYDYLFKFIIVGNSCVGKTCLLMRFADDQFTESFVTTVGVDFSIRTIDLNDKVVKLQMWDCAGQERFRSIVGSYYRGAHGVILTYSTTDRSSFDSIKYWYTECKKNCNSNINFILVGTKSDLIKKREVSHEEGELLAKELEIQFVETSARLDVQVTQAFHNLSSIIMNKIVQSKLLSNGTHNAQPLHSNKPPLEIEPNKKSSLSCCNIS